MRCSEFAPRAMHKWQLAPPPGTIRRFCMHVMHKWRFIPRARTVRHFCMQTSHGRGLLPGTTKAVHDDSRPNFVRSRL